jgi:hypothetical protein
MTRLSAVTIACCAIGIAISCRSVANGEPVANKAPASLARLLERCAPAQRSEFLSSMKFLGDKVVSYNDGSIQECLGDTTRDAVAEVLAKLGNDSSDANKGKGAPEFGELFSACSASARKDFYDRLEFRGAKVVGVYVGGIEKCGGTDLRRFLSLFADEGQAPVSLQHGCVCKRAGASVKKSGYWCDSAGC